MDEVFGVGAGHIVYSAGVFCLANSFFRAVLYASADKPAQITQTGQVMNSDRPRVNNAPKKVIANIMRAPLIVA